MSSRKTRSTCARALAAYFADRVATAGDLPSSWDNATDQDGQPAPVTIQLLEGEIKESDGELVLPESFEDMKLPALIVGCARAREHGMGGGYMICEAAIMVVTQLDEPEAARRHDERVGFVSGQLMNRVDPEDLEKDSLDIVRDELNAPTAGPDNRKVKDFTCFGFGDLEEEGTEQSRRVIDMIKLDVHCQATDLADVPEE